jgi:hypothetical protein
MPAVRQYRVSQTREVIVSAISPEDAVAKAAEVFGPAVQPETTTTTKEYRITDTAAYEL